MGSTEIQHDEYDLFLSHATPDKEWVLKLVEQLEALGLRVFVDSEEIAVGDNFVLRLSDGLGKSRYMVLVLSSHTDGRPWVEQEWTSYVAGHGPLGRLLPVKIDAVKQPFIQGATQASVYLGFPRNPKYRGENPKYWIQIFFNYSNRCGEPPSPSQLTGGDVSR